VLAFGTLLAAVLVSLYREKLLQWLAPLPAPAAASHSRPLTLPKPPEMSEKPQEPYDPWEPPPETESRRDPGEEEKPEQE